MFGIVAWQSFFYHRALAGIGFEYDECPDVCPLEANKISPAFCEECPKKEAKENFKNYSIEALDAHPKTRSCWQKYGFDNLLRTVYDISDISENLAREHWTVKTAQLVDALKTQRARLDRSDEANRKTNPE